MKFYLPCSKCNHNRVCGIKTTLNYMTEMVSDLSTDTLSDIGVIVDCPHTTSLSHQEGILQYKKCIQD